MKIEILSHKLKNSGPGSKLTFGVSIAIIAAVALYNWSVSPQTNYLQAAEQYSKVADDAQRKYAVLEKTIALREKQIVTANEEFADIKTKLFTRTQAGEFFGNIQPWASEFSCVVDSLDFSREHVIENDKLNVGIDITQRSADIAITGQYDSIVRFIDKLHQQPQKVVTSELELRVTPDFAALNCNMNITIYIIDNKESDSDVE